MTQLKYSFAVLAIVALTALPAWWHGRVLNRWGAPPNLEAAGERLHEFPRQLGDWICAEDEPPLSEPVCRELGLSSHFHRRYTHQVTGEQVEVLLMVGPPGRLVRHPPEICYGSRANEQLGEGQPLEITEEPAAHQFQELYFRQRKQPAPEEFAVAYGFASNAGVWSTPASPRMAFGAEPLLYKLQVLGDLPVEGEPDQVQVFLEELVSSFPAILVDRGSIELEQQ